MFLGLLFKALKSDINSDRMSAFAKRLTQVSYFSGFGFTICIIFQYLELLECANRFSLETRTSRVHENSISIRDCTYLSNLGLFKIHQ
jgi:hypothetical protein